MDLASVYVTCPDRASARRIARALLESRLVACANIAPIESLYRWEGRIEEAAEVAMFLKTREALVPEVVAAVEELHPHDVPCIVAFALGGGSAAYDGWVEAETTRPAPRS
jgi:periplasmic divalent cation tolerance protein